MLKTVLFRFALVIAFLFAAPAIAVDEKCYVTGTDGSSAIKAGSGDTDPDAEDEDDTAWIWVPRDECNKINRGDFSGVSAAVEAKVDKSKLPS